MELGTAGSILSYALDLEAKAAEFYQKAIDAETDTNIKTALEENIQRHRKISKTLDRMRKENVTEMILEPVHGLKSDDFVLDSRDVPSDLVTLKKIERTILEYLKVSAEKVSFLRQMQELLMDLAGRIQKNLDTLDKL